MANSNTNLKNLPPEITHQTLDSSDLEKFVDNLPLVFRGWTLDKLLDIVMESGLESQQMSTLCKHLLKHARSNDEKLLTFTMIFVPSLVSVSLISRDDVVDQLLLVIYNLGGHDPIETICAKNKMNILRQILVVYSEHMSKIPSQYIIYICKLCSKILVGVPLSSKFLVELTHCLYNCIQRGNRDLAQVAINDIHDKASTCLYSDVLLVSISAYINDDRDLSLQMPLQSCKLLHL